MYSSEIVAELTKDIGEYVEPDISKVINLMLVSEKVVFLDTGVISRIGKLKWETIGHSYIDAIIENTDPTNCVFVITEMVLYEIKDSGSNAVQKHNRDFIINMYRMGYKVVILREERVGETLNAYINMPVGELNDRFVKRVIDNRPFLRTVVNLISGESKWSGMLTDDYKAPTKSDYVSECINWLKNNKDNRDSLAEQIIAICVLILLDLPGRSYYVFYTNDKKASVNFKKIIKASHPTEIDRADVVMLMDK